MEKQNQFQCRSL